MDVEIPGLLRTYIMAATEQVNRPWVLSAFRDNAGVIAFDRQREISFKVETHNHPSAIEPFGGANTGVGGVVRDVLGVSAEPIANTDVLCFGTLDAEPALCRRGLWPHAESMKGWWPALPTTATRWASRPSTARPSSTRATWPIRSSSVAPSGWLRAVAGQPSHRSAI